MRLNNLPIIRGTALLVLFFALVACGSKVNESNYAKIEIDMTEGKVKSLLGTPTESSSINVGGLSGTSSKWVAREGTINVQFLNGKVKAKAFSKPSAQKETHRFLLSATRKSIL